MTSNQPAPSTYPNTGSGQAMVAAGTPTGTAPTVNYTNGMPWTAKWDETTGIATFDLSQITLNGTIGTIYSFTVTNSASLTNPAVVKITATNTAVLVVTTSGDPNPTSGLTISPSITGITAAGGSTGSWTATFTTTYNTFATGQSVTTNGMANIAGACGTASNATWVVTGTPTSTSFSATSTSANTSLSTCSGQAGVGSSVQLPTFTATASGGVVTAINVTTPGSGYTTAPVLFVADYATSGTTNIGSGAYATTTLNATGGIATATLVSGGSNYAQTSPKVTVNCPDMAYYNATGTAGVNAAAVAIATATGSNCSFRDALQNTNAGMLASGVSVQFANAPSSTNPAGTPWTITLGWFNAVPAHSSQFYGPGPGLLTINGQGQYQCFNGSSTDFTIEGMTFANCYYFSNGAAIEASGSSGIVIENAQFVNNYANQIGGAVEVAGGGAVFISNSQFIGNGDGMMPGAYVTGIATNSGGTAATVTTALNTHLLQGQTLQFSGLTGCAAPISGVSTPTVTSVPTTTPPYTFTVSLVSGPTSCTVTGMQAYVAANNLGGGAVATSNSSTGSQANLHLLNDTFINNWASNGGAVMINSGLYNGTVSTVANSTFYGNVSNKYGAAVETFMPTVFINDTITNSYESYTGDCDAAVGLNNNTAAWQNLNTFYNTVFAGNTTGGTAVDVCVSTGDPTDNSILLLNTTNYGTVQTTTPALATLAAAGLAAPAYNGGTINDQQTKGPSIAVTNVGVASGVATFTTASAHQYQPNELVNVSGTSTGCGASFIGGQNGQYLTVASVPTSTTFTVNTTAANCAATSESAVNVYMQAAPQTMAILPGSPLMGKGTHAPQPLSVTSVQAYPIVAITGGTINGVALNAVSVSASTVTFTATASQSLIASTVNSGAFEVTGLTTPCGKQFNGIPLTATNATGTASITASTSGITPTIVACTGTETATGSVPVAGGLMTLTTSASMVSFSANDVIFVTSLVTTCGKTLNNYGLKIVGSPTSTGFSAYSPVVGNGCSISGESSTANTAYGDVAFTISGSSNPFSVGSSVYISGLSSTCGLNYTNRYFLVDYVSGQVIHAPQPSASVQTVACGPSTETGFANYGDGMPVEDARGDQREPGAGDIGALQSKLGLAFTAVTNQNVGTPLTSGITLSLTDNGNPLPNVSGVPLVAELSPSGTLTGTGTLGTNAAGVGTLSGLTPQTPGIVNLVVNAGPGVVSATSNSFTINAATSAKQFAVTAPSNFIAGQPFTVTVKAIDTGGDVVTGYTGTVAITSSDPAATLPSNATLTSGVGTFTVTLATAGTQVVYATDTVTTSLTGASNGITSVSGSTQTITFSAPTTAQFDTTGPVPLATSNYGLPISYTITGPATLNSATNTLNITGVGAISVTASQAGGTGYTPATSVNYPAATPVVQNIVSTPATFAQTPGVVSPATTASVTVTLTFGAQTTLNATTPIVVSSLPSGTPFANAGTGTCTASQPYTIGDTCTVVLTYTPSGAGVITALVEAFDNSSTPILQAAGTATAVR